MRGRSASMNGPNGSRPSSRSRQPPTRPTAPTASTRARNSSISRVFPTPASPAITNVVARPSWIASRPAASSPSSLARPTKRGLAMSPPTRGLSRVGSGLTSAGAGPGGREDRDRARVDIGSSPDVRARSVCHRPARSISAALAIERNPPYSFRTENSTTAGAGSRSHQATVDGSAPSGQNPSVNSQEGNRV